MTADNVTVETPKHPLYALTTAELARYRRELESAVRGVADDAPVQAILSAKLDAVKAEQADRKRIADGS